MFVNTQLSGYNETSSFTCALINTPIHVGKGSGYVMIGIHLCHLYQRQSSKLFCKVLCFKEKSLLVKIFIKTHTRSHGLYLLVACQIASFLDPHKTFLCLSSRNASADYELWQCNHSIHYSSCMKCLSQNDGKTGAMYSEVSFIRCRSC